MGFQDWLRRRFGRAAPTTDPELLARLASVIEETRISYLRVEVVRADVPLGPTESKIGGVPYAPVGAELPSGEPFSFVAQINFAGVDLAPFPQRGLIQFWVVADDLYGSLRDEPTSGFRCIYYPDLDRPQRSDLPPPVEDGPVHPDRVAVGRRLTFHRETCLLAPADCRWEPFLARHQIAVDRLDSDAYDSYSNDGHRIGGYCAFTQTDPRDASDPPLSLLQLDSDENVAWGDAGIGHWFIREADLRACDFSRVEYYWDCC
ncbi:MAG TPA: DUF1963 domain-containing protein [Kofleriaceae bacterium]|jgi:uncharacterized protein YwqG|nr:DUF1963 domain-containing protein [Kofleriaceae bacterium]